MRRRSPPPARKSPASLGLGQPSHRVRLQGRDERYETRAYSLLFRNRCCPRASSARGGRIKNNELQETARPRRGDRRGFEHVDAADGERDHRGEPESAAGEASCGARPDAGPSTGAAGRKAVGRGGCGGDASRWRLAAHVQPAERRQHPRLSAADLELGEPDSPRGLQRRLLSQQGRRQARARHDQDRGEHQGCRRGSAGQFSADEDH